MRFNLTVLSKVTWSVIVEVLHNDANPYDVAKQKISDAQSWRFAAHLVERGFDLLKGEMHKT